MSRNDTGECHRVKNIVTLDIIGMIIFLTKNTIIP